MGTVRPEIRYDDEDRELQYGTAVRIFPLCRAPPPEHDAPT